MESVADSNDQPEPGLETLSTAPPENKVNAGSPLRIQVLPEDEALLTFSESVLTSRCMTQLGFTFVAFDYESLKSSYQASARAANYERFPYDSVSEGIPYVQTVEPLPEDPNAARIASMSEEERTVYGDALQGFITDRVAGQALGVTLETPREGCVSEARVQIYGSLENAMASLIVSSNLYNVAHQGARLSPEVASALESWIGCMAASGYDYEDFTQARQAAKANDALAIASADSQCVEAANLSTLYRAAYEAALRDTLEIDGRAGVDALVQVRRNALSRAKDLLSS